MREKILPEALNIKSRSWHSVLPPALIISVAVLITSLIIMSVKNIHREKNFMEKALLSEALSIAHAIEATCTCGLFRETSNPAHIEAMLIELSKQPGVLYISIVKSDGTVVADGDPSRIGSKLNFSPPTPQSKWHGLKTRMGVKAYEIVLRYFPLAKNASQTNTQQFFILIGMDPRPYQEALNQDLKFTGIILSVTLIVAIAGVATALWSSLYRRTAKSLENMETLTSLIVSRMPIGLVITDLAGNIMSLNNAADKLLQIGDVKNITDYEELKVIFEELKETGTLIEKELELKLAGKKKILLASGFKIDLSDSSIAYLMLFTDMTRLKNLEDQLNRNRRLAALGQLAAGLAHEVRNPLSSIKGFAKIIANKDKDDLKMQQILEAFAREVERLDRVITELLDFAKPTVLNKKVINCSVLVDEALKTIENKLSEKKIKVFVNIHPPNLTVYADDGKIAQVLVNIFLNAVEAMEECGTLGVVVKRENNEVVFHVSDTGHGIKSEHIDKLFDPYFTTKPHGVGLGLANVHKIVEAHGGKVEVLSVPGEGSTFIVRIPQIEVNGRNYG